jgi:hypothetical protein
MLKIGRPFCMRRLGLSLGLGAMILFSGSASAQSPGVIDEELFSVANEVSNFLKRFGDTTIAVGQFTCAPQLNSSAGPKIVKSLTDNLAERGIKIKRIADLGLKGEYRLVIQNGADGMEAVIKGSIEDLSGKHLLDFSKNIRDTSELCSLFGLTVNLPPSESEAARSKRLVASVKRPETFLKKTRISAGKDSPYGVEILVKSNDQYQAKPVADCDGLAFVGIAREEIYAVNLINDSDEDAAVTLTIDGLSMFAFSEFTDYSYIIVPKKSQGLIKGWHITNEKSDSFLVTEYSKSAAAELLSSSADLGTITATFAAAWPKEKKPPADEHGAMLALRGADATGRGPSVAAK